ncbi:MAG: hypothetical protein GY739_04025 [Mesoflavibacter sp.]|nr:hypothetical protein [Mesoflavibacter sp.]
MAYEGLINNKNAEKWTIEEATKLFNKCLVTAKDQTKECNDFIGEVAQNNNTDLTQLDYLKDKFPSLKPIYKTIKSHCESNCFRNGKKGDIVPSLAIMNLKSNHGWTDRSENTVKGNLDLSRYTDEEIEQKLQEIAGKGK